ncbi:MAG: dethiobiotin synthase [Deltaproteobacteria bacterium]|nr:dethiobiotin synthase [Deltaproteobacteria bacterium]
MARGVFVTGTDTEVGKTVVSAALVLALRDEGVDAGYLKPVASGGVELGGRLISPDALTVARLTGLPDPLDQLSPYCLKHPLAPLVAGRLEGWKTPISQVLKVTHQAMTSHDFTVVEGVGGVMVPVTSRHILLDLIVDLGFPVIIVGRPGLGTINLTLLTIHAVRDRGVKVLGFIFSGPDPNLPEDPAITHNPGIITEFSGIPYLGNLPWRTQAGEEELSGPDLSRAAREHLDLAPLLDLTGRGR